VEEEVEKPPGQKPISPLLLLILVEATRQEAPPPPSDSANPSLYFRVYYVLCTLDWRTEAPAQPFPHPPGPYFLFGKSNKRRRSKKSEKKERGCICVKLAELKS
jgi:hypothetical protein